MLYRDIGIDLGTDNILIYIRKQGIVLNEPAVVAIDSITKELLAVGEEAYRMIGRTPKNILAIRPLRDGVIADFEFTAAMLKHFLKKIGASHFFYSQRILVCCGAKSTSLEKQSIKDVTIHAGGKQIVLVEKIKAAAIGAGVNMCLPFGSMVVDIGSGTTDIAVLSMGSIVTSSSITTAGNQFDRYIERYMKETYNLLIGESTAEKIKLNIVVFPHPNQAVLEIRGRDLMTGLPRTVLIEPQELTPVIVEWTHAIVQACKAALEQTPPELSGDILSKGITITGGGALLHGLDQILAKELQVPVTMAERPLYSVVYGMKQMLESKTMWKRRKN
ncbi:MAG: rod shape-determining protein MreB [Bacilli bacterium]|nr:rod shape-determining protein MreB [Bacilli bacterium]